jgi:hypothetical protein
VPAIAGLSEVEEEVVFFISMSLGSYWGLTSAALIHFVDAVGAHGCV